MAELPRKLKKRLPGTRRHLGLLKSHVVTIPLFPTLLLLQGLQLGSIARVWTTMLPSVETMSGYFGTWLDLN
jgi:hypothetical protein